MILITNNQKVAETFGDTIDLLFMPEKSYQEILLYVRDKIHEGHKLLSHPLSGSVKPNETPFKSILISKTKQTLDYDSLVIIEDSLATVRKFNNNKITPKWTESILEDFRVIDLSLIEGAIEGNQ
jgi:hypothetical protein